MGVQRRFSETDLIPPGHTPRGLRPVAGSLHVCGRGRVLTTPNTCAHTCAHHPHPSVFGCFPNACQEPGFFHGCLHPLPSHPGLELPKASCNTVVSNSETSSWRKDEETEAQRGSRTLPGSQQIHTVDWRVAASFLDPVCALGCAPPSAMARLPSSLLLPPTASASLRWWLQCPLR